MISFLYLYLIPGWYLMNNLFNENCHYIKNTSSHILMLFIIIQTFSAVATYALGRFIKSKFWKFDISTHFLCDKYHDKEKVQKKFCSNIAPSIGTGHPLNPPFLHSKTRPKYAKYVKQPKYHFRVVKMCSKGDFSQVQGGNQVYKSGLRFSFRVLEVPFLIPPKR